MFKEKKGYYESPIGPMEIRAREDAVISVSLVEEEDAGISETSPVIQQCIRELEEYFRGERREFSVPLDPGQAPTFRAKAWQALRDIPFGETRSYGEIARILGKEGAARAVGGACHSNPLVVVVPCHRVLGSDGKLTGFGGGLWRKEWLLEHEKKHR